MNRVKATEEFRALRGTVQRRRRRSVRPGVSVLEDRIVLAAYTVISNADTNTGNPATGTGTLRWAINQLDANGDPSSTIAFDLPSNELTITPGTAGLGPLPQITEPVEIEGQTEPNFAGTPLVVINGGSAGSNANGLTLGAGSSNSVIQDLVIDGFADSGIQIDSSGDQVEGCYVGTDASGTVAVPNAQDGIDVLSSNATIGGTASGAANVISGNGDDGIDIQRRLPGRGERDRDRCGGTAAVANSGDRHRCLAIECDDRRDGLGRPPMSSPGMRTRRHRHRRARLPGSRGTRSGPTPAGLPPCRTPSMASSSCRHRTRDDRRDGLGRRQCHLRERTRRHRHRGDRLPGAGERDRDQRRWDGRHAELHPMASRSTQRVRRSAGRPRAPPMSSPGIRC